jgi:hypothetical protein
LKKTTKNESDSGSSSFELLRIGNHYNIETGSGLLHSKHNPEKEAERFLQSIPTDPESIIIIAGIGWGYVPEILIRNSEYSAASCLIYEPSREVQNLLLKSGRLKEILNLTEKKRPDLKIFFRLNELADHIKTLPGSQKKLQLTVNPAYSRLFPDLYNTLDDRLIKNDPDSKAISVFGSSWLRNSEQLWNEISPSFILKKKENKGPPDNQNIPFIYCGGGPRTDFAAHFRKY